MRCILFVLLMLPSVLWAQDLKATETLALFKLRTTMMDGERARPFEKIAFVNQESGKEIEVMTDKDGKVRVLLPKDATFDVYNLFLNNKKPVSQVKVPDMKGELIFSMNLSWEMSDSKFSLDDVHFDTGKSTLRSSSFPTLDNLVEYLAQHQSMTIEIRGHTDDQGTSSSNLQLSDDRAVAVRKYLIKEGIDASRLQSKGYGETDPIADNKTSEGRQKNRRTEVHIITE